MSSVSKPPGTRKKWEGGEIQKEKHNNKKKRERKDSQALIGRKNNIRWMLRSLQHPTDNHYRYSCGQKKRRAGRTVDI